MDYESIRVAFNNECKSLLHDLTEQYDSETFVRLPEPELEGKFDAWERFQKLIIRTLPGDILTDKNNWPKWLTSVYTKLMERKKGRLCRDVLRSITHTMDEQYEN